MDRHSAYDLGVVQAAPVAGIERTPSLVLLVEEILLDYSPALFRLYAVARMPLSGASATKQAPSEWLEDGGFKINQAPF